VRLVKFERGLLRGENWEAHEAHYAVLQGKCCCEAVTFWEVREGSGSRELNKSPPAGWDGLWPFAVTLEGGWHKTPGCSAYQATLTS
jgi:hypothetical protein